MPPDDAWGLFGDDDDDDGGGEASVAAPASSAPVASSHPFFVGARPFWCPPADDADSSLDLPRRARPVSAALRARGHALEADTLDALVADPTDASASEMIRVAVDALARLAAAEGQASAPLNAAMLLARGVKAHRALEHARRSPADAIAAAEAAVLLAESATILGADAFDATPSTRDGPPGQSASSSAAWIGALVRDAAREAARSREGAEGAEGAEGTCPTGAVQRLLPDNLPPGAAAEALAGFAPVPRRAAADVRAPEFYNAHLAAGVPTVITGVMRRDGWRAATLFRDLNWIRNTHGGVPVPVEIGRRRADGAEGSSRYELLRDFVDARLLGAKAASSDDDGTGETKRRKKDADGEDEPSPETTRTPNTIHPARVAYVSQHSLLHQSPGLQECFGVPEYTMGRLAAANAWLGTEGTVTHLHTDQADNLLCQVAGFKLVRMYPPEAGACLYEETRGGNGSLNRFSPVDAEDVDEDKFPKFADAEGGMETILGPDDALFVPCGWWHYVRALTPSFSLNFWF